ncbi:MAG: uroporphyrinogen decarboxylase [Acidobacteria bacterium]|nr:MAG: uroporphyrinogen decarboxylase [Acidobacteriota bacterium]
MRKEQWSIYKEVAKQGGFRKAPVALIVDSPWMPGYLGLTHHDYYFDPEAWFRANLRIIEEFPDIIMFPSWWVEYGMAIEPSAIGARVNFWPDRPPNQTGFLDRLEDVSRLPAVNPCTDGLMAMTLHRYRSLKGRILDAGFTIPVVAARGPLCTAAFLRGLTEFMMDVIDNPAGVHQLLEYATDVAINWLKAQAETIGETVEGILVLDDIVGFLSRDHYLKFAHPYLKRICDSFPSEWVKVYHNDANVTPFLSNVAETGFDVLNWGKTLDVAEAYRRLGADRKLVLMGNVNPLEPGVNGTPEEVKRAALDVLDKTRGRAHILSMGGGVSPGMPKANIMALLEAAREFTA